jgi:hypothetical protein
MMRKKTLLIDEYPLLVLPSLAVIVGLNEAIALQQLHYWLENPKGSVEVEGERWTFNTYEEWQEQNFPFWSVRTVQRVFQSLEKMNLVISKQLPNYDRKKYYRIHYANLALWSVPDRHHPLRQDGIIEDDKEAPSTLEETTEETTKREDGLDFENMTVSQAKKLPTLKMYSNATNFWPGDLLWETIHNTIIEHSLTEERIRAAAVAWVGRSYKIGNVQGILEWAVGGVPANGKAAQPEQRPAVNEVVVDRTKKAFEDKWNFNPAPPPASLTKPVLKQPERRLRR